MNCLLLIQDVLLRLPASWVWHLDIVNEGRHTSVASEDKSRSGNRNPSDGSRHKYLRCAVK